ncbi:MAG: pyridoxamine 5'-phosphate oxidase family protein [Clostridia bacterium]|nr:pyridoxamine 5'-phosphate oxidase family protein [Clostridia bacterium]
MFRAMRRYKQQLSQAECIEILQRNPTGVLALSGDDGYPYALPVNFAWKDGKILFHCAKVGHKIDAIKRNEKVSVCVVDADEVVAEKLTTAYRSVIVFGRARILTDDEEIKESARAVGRKFSGDYPAQIEDEIVKYWDGLCCVEITAEHITGKEGKEMQRRRSEMK